MPPSVCHLSLYLTEVRMWGGKDRGEGYLVRQLDSQDPRYLIPQISLARLQALRLWPVKQISDQSAEVEAAATGTV